jgi:hypothetical protein
MSLADDVRAGIAELGELDPRDRAAAALAVQYAEHIDDPQDWGDVQRDPLAELGPKLLAALKELGLTPAARKGIVADKVEPKPRNPLDALRDDLEAQRAKRGSAG